MVRGKHHAGQGYMLSDQLMVRGRDHTNRVQGVVNKHIVQLSVESAHIIGVLRITTSAGQITAVRKVKGRHFLSCVCKSNYLFQNYHFYILELINRYLIHIDTCTSSIFQNCIVLSC